MNKTDGQLFESSILQPTIKLFGDSESEFEISQVCCWDYDVDEDGVVTNLHLNNIRLERIK